MQYKNNLLAQWDFSPQILSGGIFKKDRGRPGKGKRFLPGPFRFYTLYAIRSGNARISLHGELYRLEAPVALLFQPGQPYEVEISRISECAWLDFGVVRRETMRKDSRQIYKDLEAQPAAQEAFGRELPLQVPDELFPETLRTCQMASGEYWKKSLPTFRAHVHLSTWLLLYLETLEYQNDSEAAEPTDRWQWILAIAEQHFHQGITATTWAERAGISKRRLDELCVTHLGYTAREHLNQLRFTYAQKLLRENTRSLTWISHQCGYPSPVSFTRWFKSRTGMPPSEWKQKHL